jgi:uncharacterized protein
MSILPSPPVTVSILAGATTKSRVYNDGYVVIPLTAAHLVRHILLDGNSRRELIEHVTGEPYYYRPENGSEISIENTGQGESRFQKSGPYPGPIPTAPQPPILPLQEISIANARKNVLGEFNVEVATTCSQQIIGLIGRPALPANQGMMMDLRAEGKFAIWMKNMLIPIDAVFVQSDGTVSQIAPNLQPNDARPVASTGVVRAVIELPAMTTNRLGITVGDMVQSSLFP